MNKFIKDNAAYIGAVIVVLIGVIFYATRHNSPPDGGPAIQNKTETSNSTMQPAEIKTPTPVSAKSNTAIWEGTLQLSNNLAKGNYLLIMSDHAIYLKTSRDFNNLIGKKVQVTYDGSLNSFVLGDITAE